MATPQFDAIKVKLRDWANRREVATIPDSVIEDCLQYGVDDIYRELRIPQLEATLSFTVEASNNLNEKYSKFDVPEDLIEFIYLRKLKSGVPNGLPDTDYMYNQVNDVRTFLDPYAEQYSRWRYVWKDLTFLVHPKLTVGDELELHYYRRLGQLDALYSVVPENYDFDYAYDAQPMLDVVLSGGTYLYTVADATDPANNRSFDNNTDATAWTVLYGGTVTTTMYAGVEAWNWLRDAHERVVIYAALVHVGLYLNDDVMAQKYSLATQKIITDLNKEDKYRKAKGGNIQINVNTGALI